MKVEYSEQAASDLDAIADYFCSIDARATGLKIIDDIYAAVERLRDNPFAWRRQDAPGVRKLVVRGAPYLVYYLVDEASNEIVVLTVRHGARRRAYQDD